MWHHSYAFWVESWHLYLSSLKHLEGKLSIEELANKYAISRRNFVRRLKKVTSITPLEYRNK
ncbi:MAG: AraC family transcriptional regulator [Cyclobacteriaceae bacterium]|nr:AraC family transcriptional regulator [Cyclobacteriaceae bacterium]